MSFHLNDQPVSDAPRSAPLAALSAHHPIGEGHLQDYTLDIGLKWIMPFSRRAACVISRFKPAIEGLVVQPPADNEDLLRASMGLSLKRRRISARQEAGQPGLFACTESILSVISSAIHPLQTLDGSPAGSLVGSQRVPVGGGFRHSNPGKM